MDSKEDHSFRCVVCCDLIYKPVVLACGHILCFWCVGRSMNFRGESCCPKCRNPYLHFPAICQMLHVLLMKMHPNAYEKRKSQVMVFCDACITLPSEEKPTCFTCQTPEPRGIPNVCSAVDQFLAAQFPEEYALRKITVQQLKQPQILSSMNACHQSLLESSFPAEKNLSWCKQDLFIHKYVGCDSCGMCLIIGDRFRCRDCVEKIGFDLCGDCYCTPSTQSGRFNQQHTPEHRFEKVTSITPRLVLQTHGK